MMTNSQAAIKSAILFLTALFCIGCGNTLPNIRQGCLPTTTHGIPFIHPKPNFLDPQNLGNHSYFPNPFEKNGIVYTCNGGHIDIAHLRANADDAKYLVKITYNALMKKKREFSFGLAFEQSRHKVQIGYPQDWDYLPEEEKQLKARELSLEIGAYLAFNSTLWHEFLTWFGVRIVLIEPEFNSAFSWEDVYSNMLGVKLAIEALRNPGLDYNRAMTIVIDKELALLNPQPRETAVEITENMRGKWFKGIASPEVYRRNTDIGVDDGYITPVLTPGACEDAQPQLLAVPKLDLVQESGFSIKYTIVPVYLEANKTLEIAYPNQKSKTIEPARDYWLIIEFINRQAKEKYNYETGAQ